MAAADADEARAVRRAAMEPEPEPEPEPQPQPEPQPTEPGRAPADGARQRGPSGAIAGASALQGASPAEVTAAAELGSALPWAEQLDAHTAYQPALQPHPEDDVDFYLQAYEHLHAGVAPKTLREDFCGTMLVSLAWVKSAPDRRACGVDLDTDVIAWAEQHNISKESPAVQERVEVVAANVLDPPAAAAAAAAGASDEKFDVICANNYSHQCLKTKPLMLQYLKNCRAALAPGGIFVLDLCGGPECEQNSYLLRTTLVVTFI